jgi:hypothetical protein
MAAACAVLKMHGLHDFAIGSTCSRGKSSVKICKMLRASAKAAPTLSLRKLKKSSGVRRKGTLVATSVSPPARPSVRPVSLPPSLPPLQI